ncbi:MAG: hypothetical protein ABIT58_01060 [Ferruginibacter sp.]
MKFKKIVTLVTVGMMVYYVLQIGKNRKKDKPGKQGSIFKELAEDIKKPLSEVAEDIPEKKMV